MTTHSAKSKNGYLPKLLVNAKVAADVNSANAMLILASLVLLFVSTVFFLTSAAARSESGTDRITGVYSPAAAHADSN